MYSTCKAACLSADIHVHVVYTHLAPGVELEDMVSSLSCSAVGRAPGNTIMIITIL